MLWKYVIFGKDIHKSENISTQLFTLEESMSHAYIGLLGLWWAFGAYMIYFLGSGSNFPLLNFDHQQTS